MNLTPKQLLAMAERALDRLERWPASFTTGGASGVGGIDAAHGSESDAPAGADLREAFAVAREHGDVYSQLRVALSRHRLIGVDDNDLVRTPFGGAVAGYADDADVPELLEARRMMIRDDGCVRAI